MTKILCVLGSPRKNGNSATIAKHFLNKAESLGAETKSYVLNDLSFRGCQSCLACKKELDRCTLKDDLTEVLEEGRTADVIVIATPVYGGYVPGQLKCFMDRTYSYLGPDYIMNPQPSRLPPGKKSVLIVTHGNPVESMYADLYRRYTETFKRSWRAEENYLIIGCGLAPTATPPEKLLKRAEELAQSIVAS